MSVVTAVRENDWDKDGVIVKVANVTFDDGTEAPGYDLPSVPEVGKPLPSGWEVAIAKSGKNYIKVPKAGKGGFGGGPAAFRNTKEGFLLEQESIHRSVALQRAVEFHEDVSVSTILSTANQFYDWLRQTAAGPLSPVAGEGLKAPASPSPTVPPQKDEGPADRGEQARSGGGKAHGEGATTSGKCLHGELSTLKPDGKALPKGVVRCLDCGSVMKGEVPA